MEELRTSVVKLEERFKENSRRLDMVENTAKEVNELNVLIRELIVEMKNLKSDVERVDQRIAEIEKKPSQRLSEIVTVLITAVISTTAGYFLSLLLGR